MQVNYVYEIVKGEINSGFDLKSQGLSINEMAENNFSVETLDLK